MSGQVVPSSDDSERAVFLPEDQTGGGIKPSDIIGLGATIPGIGPFAGLASGVLRLFGGSLAADEKKKLGFTKMEMDMMSRIHDRAVLRARKK